MHGKRLQKHYTNACAQGLPEKQASFVVYQAKGTRFFGQASQDEEVQDPMYLLD